MTLNPFAPPKIRQAWSYRDEPENIAVIALVCWRTLLCFALIVVIAAVWFGYGELGAASQVETPQAVVSNAPPALDKGQLQATLNAIVTKQTQYQQLTQSPVPTVADPSK